MRIAALSGDTIANLDETLLRQITSGVGLGAAVKKFLEPLLGISAYRLKLLLEDEEVSNALPLDLRFAEVDLQLVILPYCQEAGALGCCRIWKFVRSKAILGALPRP